MRSEGFTLIGRKGDDYYFCDSVFDRGDGFQGATGSIIRPVSPEEWEWASDPENVAERVEDYYKHCINPDDDPDCVTLDDFVERAIRIDGIGHIMFDDSFGCNASDAFDELGIEHEYTDCSGCGRIFGNNDFDEVFNRKALVAIEALEDGAVSAYYAAKIVFGG